MSFLFCFFCFFATTVPAAPPPPGRQKECRFKPLKSVNQSFTLERLSTRERITVNFEEIAEYKKNKKYGAENEQRRL